ncbi:MAG: tRNA pseudouridine(38-40) synthase TruA [Undibacterium sp.]|nr:tRNA pseudouridine(38-40) synthase TruA [Undibacterium sp.]
MQKKRIVLGLEYDGAGFQGWQTQPSGNTVQDVLTNALGRFSERAIAVYCAGRTDAGVHAVEQVVHFDTELERAAYSWVSGVNTFLPASIVVRWAKQVALVDETDQQGFHARFSAHSRTYHYLLHNHAVRSPLWAGRAGWFFHRLDLQRMQVAAALMLGERDFTVFRAAACQAKSPVKHMYEIKIRQQGDLFVFSLRANAFLHHMVRNIVGSLIYVGMGKREPEWVGELMHKKDRSLAAPTFMPDGLYLAKIGYDRKWDLPENQGENLPYALNF